MIHKKVKCDTHEARKLARCVGSSSPSIFTHPGQRILGQTYDQKCLYAQCVARRGSI